MSKLIVRIDYIKFAQMIKFIRHCIEKDDLKNISYQITKIETCLDDAVIDQGINPISQGEGGKKT